jgi:hypothetical protein
MFKRAILALSDVQVRAQEFRDHFLEDKAKMAQDEGEIELARIILAIKAAEARQRIWNKLRRVKGKYFTSGIDHVIDTDSDGNQIPIHEPDAMFAALIDRKSTAFFTGRWNTIHRRTTRFATRSLWHVRLRTTTSGWNR